jgi:hypothetical protein
MMRIEKLNYYHKALISGKLRELALDFSEYTFASLYLFRKIHDFEVLFAKDVYIRGVTRDHFTFLMLTSPIEKVDLEEITSLLNDYDCLFPIPEKWLHYFDPEKFQKTFSDDDNDYIFSAEKICTYPGRHLDGKRNLVRQFMELYDCQSSLLNADNVKDAAYVLEVWKEEIHQELCSTDYCSAKEALRMTEELDLSGKIYYVNQEPIGFVLGESIHSQLFAIHFAKANKKFKGVYQFIFQDYACFLKNTYPALNFEQDLGLPDLRKAKQSYYPDQLLKKWRLFRRRLI